MDKLDMFQSRFGKIDQFGMGFMDIIPSTAPKRLTSDTTFPNYTLIFDAYSKIPKLYGMEKITTEEVMDKLDIFQYRFGKIDEFGWWDLERISSDAGTYAFYLDGVQRRMPNLRSSFDVSGT